MTDLERMVNDALALSETAKSEAAHKLAAAQRKAAMDAINEQIARIGRMISVLNSYDKASR